MTKNIPPHPNPLPPRGEGVRREKFHPNVVVIFILLLFLLVVISVE